jgi:hypothetical protein
MRKFASFVAALVAAGSIAGTAYATATTGSQAVTTLATGRSTQYPFVSKLYRYSIVLPGATSRWSSIFATQRWLGDSLPGIGDPELDTVTDVRTGRTYLLAALPTESS